MVGETANYAKVTSVTVPLLPKVRGQVEVSPCRRANKTPAHGDRRKIHRARWEPRFRTNFSWRLQRRKAAGQASSRGTSGTPPSAYRRRGLRTCGGIPDKRIQR